MYKKETLVSNIKTDMAIDNKREYKRQIFDRPTTEEYEKRKIEFAGSVSNEMINSFSAEDRFDIFNIIRRELEKALRIQCEELANKLKNDTEYFEGIKNLIY